MKEGFKKFAKKTLATVGTTAILATNAAKATTADLLAKIKDKKIDFTEKVADNTKVATTNLKMVMAHNDKTVWTKNPEYLDGNGEPIFKFENGKLVLTDKKFIKLQPVLDDFYKIQNKELIKLTENGIIAILRDSGLDQSFENMLIQQFLQAALGNGEMPLRFKGIAEPHQTNFKKIRKLAGNPANLDKDGNINETEQILQKIIDQATKVSLDKLMTNPTFGANFEDAKRLDDKWSELMEKKTLDKDEKTMLVMYEYYKYKGFPKTCIPKAVRAFLSGYNNDISYMDPNKLTDDFVVSEYIRIMEEYENLFQTTADLKPDLEVEVDVEDLY